MGVYTDRTTRDPPFTAEIEQHQPHRRHAIPYAMRQNVWRYSTARGRSVSQYTFCRIHDGFFVCGKGVEFVEHILVFLLICFPFCFSDIPYFVYLGRLAFSRRSAIDPDGSIGVFMIARNR